MKQFSPGERLFATDLNDNFDETQKASNVTSGAFAAARIGNLPTSKITSGTFSEARIPASAMGPMFSTSGSNTVAVSFDRDRVITRSATGTVTFTGSSYTAGKSVSVRIVAGSSNRTLNFPAGWKFVSFKPTSILKNKVGVLAVTSFGTSEANCVAAFAVQT